MVHSNPDDERPDELDIRLKSIAQRITAEDAASIDAPDSVWSGIIASIREEESAQRPKLHVLDGGATPPQKKPWRLLGVAAAVVLVAAAAGVVVGRTAGQGRGTELVASTRLGVVDATGAGTGAGTAQLVRQADGTHLVVKVKDMSPAQKADFFELWLLDATNGNPQSLGKMTPNGPDTVDVVVPASVSTSEFPVVDISSEIDDGDSDHSGLSILRGKLS